MATLIGAIALTLSDWLARQPAGSDKKIGMIIEILKQTNRILDDMPFMEGNLPTGHMTTVRTGLPTVAWRRLNYGVPQSKSRTVQVTDSCGMLEAYATVDKRLADLNGNTAEFRMSEEIAFIQSMNHEAASAIFYSNTALTPQQILGLAPRYDDLSAENAENIIDAEGTGSNLTSIWLVVWGDTTCHGIYPKGGKAGLRADDITVNKELGDKTLDELGNPYQAYSSHYSWDLGLCLRDWRYVVRIANIDIDTLSKKGGIVYGTLQDAGSNGPDLIDLCIQALETPPSLDVGTAVFYANKTILSWMRRQMRLSSNINLTLENIAGRRVVAFDGIPFHKVDAILNAEDRVV